MCWKVVLLILWSFEAVHNEQKKEKRKRKEKEKRKKKKNEENDNLPLDVSCFSIISECRCQFEPKLASYTPIIVYNMLKKMRISNS
jgi:GTP-sensing pleiotropic transcriptional regulator CodY